MIRRLKYRLFAVLAAEEEAERREEQAKAEAKESIAEASRQAERLIADAEKEAADEAEKLFKKAKDDGEDQLVIARHAADAKCSELEKTAEKNRADVIQGAVNTVLL